MENPALMQALGRPGNLLAVYSDVVPAGGYGGDAKGFQRRAYRPRKPRDRKLLRVPRIGDEGIVKVSQVVVYRAAPSCPAHDGNAAGLHEAAGDLLLGILIHAHHHGVCVLPEDEPVALAFCR